MTSQVRAQSPAPEGTVRLTPALSSVPATEGAFTVYIVLENLNHAGSLTYDDNRDGIPDRQIASVGMGAFEFTISYDPAILSVGAAQRGPELNRSGRSFQCLSPEQEPGTFKYGCLSLGQQPDGAQGTLTIASVEFAPNGSGFSPLSLAAQIVGPLGDEAPVDAIGGAVRVTGSSPVTRTPTAPGAQSSPGTAVTPRSTAATTTTATAPRGTSVGATPTLQEVAVTRSTAATKTPSGGAPTPSGSGGDGMWWAIGIGAVVGTAALGMVAVLWRRGGTVEGRGDQRRSSDADGR